MNPKKLTIILIIVLAVVFVISIFVATSITKSSSVKIVERSVLTIDLSNNYPEISKLQFNPFTFKREIPFYKLIFAVESASNDKNIESILIKGYSTLGLSRTWELMQALKKFKKSGKKVYGYFDYGGLSTLMLASLCDTAATCPQGTFFAPGLMAHLLFLKNTFAKIGIGFDVIHIGKYKSAGEMFANDSMSVWTRESYNKLLDDLYAQVLDDWSGELSVSKDSVKSIIDKAILSSDDVKEMGIVDTITYWNDFKKYLVGKNDERLVSVARYSSRKFVWERCDTTIALVIAAGNITDNADRWSNAITPKRYAKIFRKLADDKNISAIVFRIDSPGGSALASDVIYNEVARAAKKKPVIVSMSSVAASGGYYISMAADTIFATPYTMTGSIGVIMLKPHFDQLYKKIGAYPQTIKRGKYADILTGDHPLTDDERAIFTKSLMQTYKQFVEKAALGRDTSYSWIDSVAQGRVWSSVSAESLALIDTIGSLLDAVAMAEKLSEVPAGKRARITIRPRPTTFWDLAKEFETSVVADVLPDEITEKFHLYELAKEFNSIPLYILSGNVSEK